MEDHRVVIWGPELAEVLRRVPDANATPDMKVLDLWMTEVSTKSSKCFTKEDFEEDFCANKWIRKDFVRYKKRGPRIEIPGEWNVARNGDKTSPGRWGQCAEAQFDYMTTTDMKSFRIKTATESSRYKGTRTSSVSAQREHIVIYYDVILEVTGPQEDHHGTKYFGIPLIFSLNDSSQDDADQECYVESFGERQSSFTGFQ